MKKSLTRLLPFVLWLQTSPVLALSNISGRVEVLEEENSKSKVVVNVWVYVDGLEMEVSPEVLDKRYTIRMENKSFAPRVEAVPAGGTVNFPNVDKIMHNAFSLSRGNRFDLGLYKAGAAKKHRFESPGLVRIYCNIHPQMSAFVLVVDNPYFAKVQPNGAYRIAGVPPGTYTVKAWNEKARGQKRVTVGKSGARGVNFTLDGRRFKRTIHLNKFGKPYKRKRGKY